MKIAEREDALALYTSTDWPVKKIAQRIGANERTVAKWAKEGGWDEIRERQALTIHAIRDLTNQISRTYLEQLNKKLLDKAEITSADIDALNKLSLALERIHGRETSLMYINAFEGFLPWLQARDLKLAQMIGPQTEEFVALKVQEEKRRTNRI